MIRISTYQRESRQLRQSWKGPESCTHPSSVSGEEALGEGERGKTNCELSRCEAPELLGRPLQKGETELVYLVSETCTWTHIS